MIIFLSLLPNPVENLRNLNYDTTLITTGGGSSDHHYHSAPNNDDEETYYSRVLIEDSSSSGVAGDHLQRNRVRVYGTSPPTSGAGQGHGHSTPHTYDSTRYYYQRGTTGSRSGSSGGDASSRNPPRGLFDDV